MRKFLVTVNGNSYEVLVEEVGGVQHIQVPAASLQAVAPLPVQAPAALQAPVAPQAVAATNGEKVVAPMPGSILSVNVQVGQAVKAGDVVVVLEAMKMENEIPSPVRGKVLQIMVNKGDTVNSGDVMIVIG